MCNERGYPEGYRRASLTHSQVEKKIHEIDININMNNFYTLQFHRDESHGRDVRDIWKKSRKCFQRFKTLCFVNKNYSFRYDKVVTNVVEGFATIQK